MTLVYYAEYKTQPRLQREGGTENLTIGLQQVIATLLRRTQIGLCTVVQAFIWRRSSARKPVEKAVLLKVTKLQCLRFSYNEAYSLLTLGIQLLNSSIQSDAAMNCSLRT